MRREDLNYLIGILLIFSVAITATLGYIQSQLELRKFFPHRYAAYTTLSLTAIHIYLNINKVWRYLRQRLKR